MICNKCPHDKGCDGFDCELQFGKAGQPKPVVPDDGQSASTVVLEHDFDEWKENPYTKVLQDSISRDYAPRWDVAAAIEVCAKMAEDAGVGTIHRFAFSRLADEIRKHSNKSKLSGGESRPVSGANVG